MTLFQNGGRLVKSNWILLDNRSPILLFTNGDLLTNIRNAHCDKYTTLNTYAGRIATNQIGKFHGCGMVWYHSHRINNAFSLGLISTYLLTPTDTSIDNTIFIEKDDDS